MTDRLEAARAFVAAGDALNSPEHQADVEQLREISNRVTARQEAFNTAQEALFEADRRITEQADAEIIYGDSTDLDPVPEVETINTEDFFRPPFDHAHAHALDEFSSSRANGLYAED